jgi:hypothetical protein
MLVMSMFPAFDALRRSEELVISRGRTPLLQAANGTECLRLRLLLVREHR